MDQSQDSQHDYSGIADQFEAKASELEAANGAAFSSTAAPTCRYLTFGSKLAYTACYTLSYGVCFPVFLACRYVPKNNELVNGLVDGGKSANKAVDELMSRARDWRISRQESAVKSQQEEECVRVGAEALASA